jgi:hypothetical protein
MQISTEPTFPKGKSLFDLLNIIYTSRDYTAFDNLSDADKKSWNTYVIHRFISMNANYIPITNEIQKYNLSPNIIFRLYVDVLPRQKVYNKYIKSDSYSKHDLETIDLVAKYFQISRREAIDYIQLLSEDDLNRIFVECGLVRNKK